MRSLPWNKLPRNTRLILEIPRGSERYRELHALRSATERTNSTLKEENAILREPPVRSLRRTAVVSQIGVITTLIERVMRLVLDITIKERKFKATGDKHWFDQLSPPRDPGLFAAFC